MMLTRRQQFRRCRVRRRGSSPVKGRRGGSADGSSYCGSELGSLDATSFRTAHSHAGGAGGGDSCCVSPLSSVGTSPCPAVSPLQQPVAPSTLGLTGSPPPVGPPPPHPLALASPAEPTVRGGLWLLRRFELCVGGVKSLA